MESDMLRRLMVWVVLLSVSLWSASPVPARSRQMLVVVSSDWTADHGRLYRFERKGKRWYQAGRSIAVKLGRNGLGWGRGLHGYRLDSGPVKREGDKRAPAGVFSLPYLFGEGANIFRYPYRRMTVYHRCVDDRRSRYYNRVIDSRKVRKDYRSFEKMKFPGGLYRYGIFVAHNPERIPGAGSCIFLHIQRSDGRATVGCTAMKRRDLVTVMRWLDPAKEPVLIQAPRGSIRRLLPDNFQLTQLR